MVLALCHYVWFLNVRYWNGSAIFLFGGMSMFYDWEFFENFLHWKGLHKIYGDDGWTTVWMFLIPMNFTLKNS